MKLKDYLWVPSAYTDEDHYRNTADISHKLKILNSETVLKFAVLEHSKMADLIIYAHSFVYFDEPIGYDDISFCDCYVMKDMKEEFENLHSLIFMNDPVHAFNTLPEFKKHKSCRDYIKNKGEKK